MDLNIVEQQKQIHHGHNDLLDTWQGASSGVAIRLQLSSWTPYSWSWSAQTTCQSSLKMKSLFWFFWLPRRTHLIHSINCKQFIIQFWKWCAWFLTLKLFIWSFLEICELLWIIVHPVPYCLHGFKKCAMKLYLLLYNGLKHCFEIEFFFLHMFKNLGTWLANNTQSQFM